MFGQIKGGIGIIADAVSNRQIKLYTLCNGVLASLDGLLCVCSNVRVIAIYDCCWSEVFLKVTFRVHIKILSGLLESELFFLDDPKLADSLGNPLVMRGSTAGQRRWISACAGVTIIDACQQESPNFSIQ